MVPCPIIGLMPERVYNSLSSKSAYQAIGIKLYHFIYQRASKTFLQHHNNSNSLVLLLLCFYLFIHYDKGYHVVCLMHRWHH